MPANKKWYARIAVQQLLLDALEGLKLQWPDPEFDVDLERELVRAVLNGGRCAAAGRPSLSAAWSRAAASRLRAPSSHCSQRLASASPRSHSASDSSRLAPPASSLPTTATSCSRASS